MVFWNVVFATTNAGAAIGENIAQLVARYGEPENGFALMLGFGTWKTKQGEVQAVLEDGKAALMAYNGGLDEKTKKSLLERNLPSGQTWVHGDAFKDFAVRLKASDPDPKEIGQGEFFQTADVVCACRIGSKFRFHSCLISIDRTGPTDQGRCERSPSFPLYHQ